MASPDQVLHGWMYGRVFMLTEDLHGEGYIGQWKKGDPVIAQVTLTAGTRVKVVSVSRFWDCGITPDLDAVGGYMARVDPGILKLAGREETEDEVRLKAEAHDNWVRQCKLFAELEVALREYHANR